MWLGLSLSYWATLGAGWLAAAILLLVFVKLRPWRSARAAVRRGAGFFFLLWTLAALFLAAESLFVACYCTTDSFGLSLVSARWQERYVARNNWDCRDRKYYRGQPAEGVKRLTILGDSFAFGHGVAKIEDRFGERLGAKLSATGAKWEVQNLAEPGASTKWEAERLEQLAAKEGYRTDVVLLAYCLNDLEDLVPETADVVGSIILDKPSNYFCREFHLPNFLYYRWRQFGRPEVQGYFGWLKKGYEPPLWDKQRERLDRIVSWCAERKVKLVVAIFPFMAGLGDDYAFAAAHRRLDAYFKEKNVPCCDLLPVYREHRGERLVVNRYDAHPNERAHALAADAIWDLVLKSAAGAP